MSPHSYEQGQEINIYLTLALGLTAYHLCLSSAEFVISLAETNTTFDAFKSVLLKNGAEFTVG